MRLRVAAIVCGLGALALAGAAAPWLSARIGGREAAVPVVFAVGAERLAFASAYLRPDSRRGGALAEVRIAAFFPDFAPAGDLADVGARTDLAERFARLVFIAIKPADPRLDPAERVARLYLRFLDEVSWSHPGGLVARAFVDGGPFEGDELYYVEPEGREFAARCLRPDPARKTPNACVYAFRMGDLDVEVRFPADLLADWTTLKAGAHGLVEAARR